MSCSQLHEQAWCAQSNPVRGLHSLHLPSWSQRALAHSAWQILFTPDGTRVATQDELQRWVADSTSTSESKAEAEAQAEAHTAFFWFMSQQLHPNAAFIFILVGVLCLELLRLSTLAALHLRQRHGNLRGKKERFT
jgi:hypothetical protein